MIIHHVEQGSPEWHQARAGVITTSMFSTIRKRLKNGDWSQAAKDYAYTLAVERISGEPFEGEQFVGWQARRGTALEGIARRLHERLRGITVEQVGFIATGCGRFGASADGLIGDDAGVEYKCFLNPQKVHAIRHDGDLSTVMDQIQGGMWITGRDQWHFCLYLPALASIGQALHHVVVNRDPYYIAELERDLLAFDELVEQYRAQEQALAGEDQRGLIAELMVEAA